MPLPGLLYLQLMEVSYPWSNKMVHMGISDDPRVSKLPCGESAFAVRENASKHGKENFRG